MTERKELIRELNQRARKVRIINTILSIVVTLLVCIAFYTTNWALGLKQQAETTNKEKTELLVVKEELLNIKEELLQDLKISEENLQGEKEKLELIKVKYDSIRTKNLAQNTDLWNYAVQQNSVQAYTDYLNLRGNDDNDVIGKIRDLLTHTGYVQITESNGREIFVEVEIIDSQYQFLKPTSSRSVRRGVIGNRNYRDTSRNGDVIFEGEMVIVVETDIMSGNSRWAKIRY